MAEGHLAGQQGLIAFVVPAQALEPGAFPVNAVELDLLLFELLVPGQELVDVEVKGVIGEFLVRLDDAGYGVGHGLIIRLHLEQQQNQGTQ